MRRIIAGRPGLTIADLAVAGALVAGVAAVGLRQVAAARQEVREELALQNVRALGTACRWYHRATGAYPEDLSRLGLPESDPPYVAPALAQADPIRQGYVFDYDRTAEGFRLAADPTRPGQTARRRFVTDHTLVVRSTLEDRQATSQDPVIQ
jgi:type II secretory pathway pseudopilin PulG